MCCVCSCPLSKKNSSYLSDVRVFNCGHATHIQCELVESGNTMGEGGSLSGCPVCLPKKSDNMGRSKSSSFLQGEEGLIAASSRHYGRSSESSTVENHNEGSDNSYSGLQQLSRVQNYFILVIC